MSLSVLLASLSRKQVIAEIETPTIRFESSTHKGFRFDFGLVRPSRETPGRNSSSAVLYTSRTLYQSGQVEFSKVLFAVQGTSYLPP